MFPPSDYENENTDLNHVSVVFDATSEDVQEFENSGGNQLPNQA